MVSKRDPSGTARLLGFDGLVRSGSKRRDRVELLLAGEYVLGFHAQADGIYEVLGVGNGSLWDLCILFA